jgi:DNA-binding winged helix-turn-helix (wHTH) protein
MGRAAAAWVTAMKYAFDEWILDLDAFELRRDGEQIPLQPKVFDVLRHLVEHRDRVVPKSELLDQVWPDVHVNDNAVTWCITHLRKALGQERGQKKPIETVHGRGYRFTAGVHRADPAGPATIPPGPPPAPSSEAKGPTGGEPFVGRDGILGQLRKALEQARDGHGSVVVLSGEAGIGKTRCATELTAHAATLGVPAWSARCFEREGQPPFWAWLQLLRRAAGTLPDEDPRAQELAALMQELAPIDADEQEKAAADRFWLHDRMHGLLLQLGREPHLLVIDDVQWADAASWEQLTFAAPDLRSTHLLVLVTLREPITDERVERELRKLRRHAEVIQLSGLSEADVERYLDALGDGQQQDPTLGRALYSRTGGNPLFIKETLRWLKSRHNAEKRPARGEFELPDVARTAVRDRLASTSGHVREVLNRASVAGTSFDVRLLRGDDDRLDDILDTLDEATRLGLLERLSQTRFRFTHDLAREVIYDDLEGGERRAHHLVVGTAMQQFAELENRWSELAFHFNRALPHGDPEAAASAARRAARAAFSVHAHADAARYIGWALEAYDLAGDLRPDERIELLLQLGGALRASGDSGGSRKRLMAALALARKQQRHDLVPRIVSRLRPTFAMASVPDPVLLDALEEGLTEVGDRDPLTRMRLLGQLARLPPYAYDMEKSKAMAAEGLALARTLPGPQATMEALHASLHALSGPDDVDALLEATDELARLDEGGPLTLLAHDAVMARLQALVLRGDMTAAYRELEKYGARAERLGLTEGGWLHQRMLAQREYHEGRFDEAAARYERLRERGLQLRLNYATGFYLVQIGQVIQARENMARILPEVRKNRSPSQSVTPTGEAALLAMETEAGIGERSRGHYERIADGNFEDIPRDLAWLVTLCHLATVARGYGDVPRMQRLYEMLQPYGAFNTPSYLLLCEGSVAHFLGILAGALGETAAAVAHLEQAIAHNEAMGFVPFALRSTVELAAALAESDRDRSRDLAGQALKAAEELGMKPLAQRARALTD